MTIYRRGYTARWRTSPPGRAGSAGSPPRPPALPRAPPFALAHPHPSRGAALSEAGRDAVRPRVAGRPVAPGEGPPLVGDRPQRLRDTNDLQRHPLLPEHGRGQGSDVAPPRLLTQSLSPGRPPGAPEIGRASW